MKKFILALVSLLLVFSFVSCVGTVIPNDTLGQEDTALGSEETAAPETNASETSVPETEGADEETVPPIHPEPDDEYSEISKVTPSAKDGFYLIHFMNGRTVELDATAAKTAYDRAVAAGFGGTLTAWISLSAVEVENKLYRGSDYGALAFGGALVKMLENYTAYFSVGGEMETYEVKVIQTEGFIDEYGNHRPNSATQTYRYTQPISVKPGQTFELINNGKNLPMRFAMGFVNGSVVLERSLVDTSCTTTVYEVQKDVTQVVATFRAVEGDVYARVSGKTTVQPILRSKVDADTLAELINGAPVASNPDLVATSAVLKDGYIYLGENHVMHNKSMKLTFNVSELKDGEKIVLGHGEKIYGGSAVEITKDRIIAYYYANTTEERFNVVHGLTLSGEIEISVDVGFAKATVSVENAEEKFTTNAFFWGGRNGKIFAKSEGAKLENVELEWSCSDYDKEIWLLGDSYFNTADANRWPYYLLGEGYTKYFMSGFPGRNCQDGLADFKRALEHGTPKYAVWCLGMNNGDSEYGVNSNWQNCVDEFLKICKEKGITPILSTIPNTPTVINSPKNEVVRNSGYRYIDFAAAVGATEVGSSWGVGMLAGDNVHPDSLGAIALYNQVKKDFPEILVK